MTSYSDPRPGVERYVVLLRLSGQPPFQGFTKLRCHVRLTWKARLAEEGHAHSP